MSQTLPAPRPIPRSILAFALGLLAASAFIGQSRPSAGELVLLHPSIKAEALPLIGASDYPSLWNQKPREGMHLHWDGDNDSVDERNLSAALGAGVTPVTVDHDNLKRVRDWIWTLPPPTYPYAVDDNLAARGASVYQQFCVDCHADGRFREGVKAGTRVGTVVPIETIGTDRHRLDTYTSIFAANQYGLYPNSEYRFTHFRKTNGYANHPLDGIWLRGPYLHNGAVPTLRDLLDPPEKRPPVFYRGYDTFEAMLEAVEEGDLDRAVLPLENSISGSVTPNYDLLARMSLAIVGEEIQEVDHCLLALKDVEVSRIRRFSAALSAVSRLAKTCRVCAARSPLPTSCPLASNATWPER